MEIGLLRRTARTFREECRACPQNAKLFSDDVLLEVLLSDSGPRAKAVALAELAVRQMLSPKRYEDLRTRFDVTKALGERFGAKAYSQFQLECERCASSSDVAYAVDRAFRRLGIGDDAQNPLYETVLEDVLRPWLEADGVIPVFSEKGAYLLPFSFVDGDGGGDKARRVIDGSGVEIPEWTEHLMKFAEDERIVADVRVSICQNENVSCTGNSMMLPILMAWWRRNGELPRYDVLRFIATGAYDGACLGRVDTAEKEALVRDCVHKGLLIRPGSGRQHGELPVGIGREKLLQRLCALAEESYDCSVAYACVRLESFDRMVRERHWGDWSSLVNRLEHLFAGVTDKDPEERLWGLMLRSAACCHAGQTEKAHELNVKAREFAARMPEHRPQLLRLQIEELVILQDEEDFESIYRLAPELEREVEAFAVAEKRSDRAVDLQMRYWGTMGQVWLCDAVAHQDAELAKRSHEDLSKSLHFAGELYARSKTANGRRAESSAYANYAQDANYLLLWAAFFNRSNVADAVRIANEEASSQANDGKDGEGAGKNDGFRRRYIALAKYRAVLDGDLDIPKSDEDDEVAEMAEHYEELWVAATACKYLGAAAAATGDDRQAHEWFDRALAKMQVIREDGKSYGFVMRIIHMTVLAEAYRSLRAFDAQREFAQGCRADALSMLDAEGITTRGKGSWKSWLESEGSDDSFPGKTYWH